MRKVSDAELVHKYTSLKSSAGSRGITFNLSLRKLRNLLRTTRCYYTGIKFDDKIEENRRSIERIDSDLGYIDSNVVACIASVNTIKSNLPVHVIIKMGKKLEQFMKTKPKNK